MKETIYASSHSFQGRKKDIWTLINASMNIERQTTENDDKPQATTLLHRERDNRDINFQAKKRTTSLPLQEGARLEKDEREIKTTKRD